MRIAHMIDNLTVGGAQTLLATFADALEPAAGDMSVISLRDDPHPALVSALERAGVEIAFHHAPRLAAAGRARRLVEHVKTQRFDVVVTHLFHANMLGAWVRRFAGVPVVTVLHNIVPPTGVLRTPLWRRAVRSGSDAVVACGHAVQDVHGHWLRGARFVTLPNPVALPPPVPEPDLRALRASILGEADATLVVSVGTISRQKAFEDLVAALAQVDHGRHPVHLAIAGRGKPQAVAALEKEIDARGMRKHVTLLGQRDDIPALLQAADLYVSSSHWEGLPISILEAMAAGLPVVATDVGDNARIVPPDAGQLVEPGRPDLLGRALERLLADPDAARHCGRQGHLAVTTHHDPQKWVAAHLDLYRTVIDARAGRRRA